MFTELEKTITHGWEIRDQLNATTTGDIPEAVRQTLAHLDAGEVRIAENIEGHWKVHEWAKKAVLLSFRLRDCFLITDPHNPSYDKIGLKFEKWTFDQFKEAGFRVVPGATVRHSAYIAPGVVLMPSFVNVGAYVGQGTMVDTGARIGSCAQVGKNCHISGGVGLGGVLEPLQANPVIIEDNCFIGANSEIAEGVVVETGAVIGMGVMLGASTKIVDRETGEITFGRIPAYSVVVPGSLPGKPLADGTPGVNLNCAVIIKRVDEKTRSKTAINELLR